VIYFRDGRRYYGKEPSHSSVQPVESPSFGGGRLARLATMSREEREEWEWEAAERERARSRPPQSWAEEKERREREGHHDCRSLTNDERAKLYQKSRQSPNEDAPLTGRALALAIVNSGRRLRGETELKELKE
jgi:hypothetical protein